MGLIAKATTGRLTQPQPMTVGPWVNELAAESDLLDATVAVRLAMHRAFINTDPGKAESYFVFPNEKRIPAATAGMRKKRVIVRVDVNDQQLTCGAPGHGWLTKDWALEAKAKHPGNGAVVVAQRRTIDDAVPNSDLLKRTRDTIAAVMHDGPGRVTVAPGGFNLDGMVERRTVPEDSLFYGDHFYPVPDSFHHEAAIDLPAGSKTAIQGVLHNDFSPAIPSGSGREGIALDGGRGLESCFIDLTSDDAHPRLVFHLPADEGTVSRQRTFRAALRCLLGLSAKLAGRHDEAAAALRSFIEVSTEGRLDPERRSRFISASGKNEPIGVIVLKPGAQLPVISTVQTTCDGPSIDDFLSIAMGWVLPRERSWSQGLRPAARDKNRRFTRRGPAQRVVDGKLLRTYRYCECNPQAFERLTQVDDSLIWFWQVNVTTRELSDGRTEARLWVSSLSRYGDILCYGQELARFLAAFEWQVKWRDPNAAFRTASLTV